MPEEPVILDLEYLLNLGRNRSEHAVTVEPMVLEMLTRARAQKQSAAAEERVCRCPDKISRSS